MTLPTPPTLPPRERTIALSALGLLALVTADVVVGGYLTHLDGQVRDLLVPTTASVPTWLATIGAIGDVGVASPIALAAAIVACQRAWRLWPAILATSTLAAVELAVLALKWAVGRPGPGVWADRTGYPGYFPSGHAATTATLGAVVVFLAVRSGAAPRAPRNLPELCLGCGLALGLLGGTCALLADTHWATDVIGGVLLAAAITLPALSWCGQYLDARTHAAAAR
jgi:undecaprenyl-diphosphatase